MAYLNGNRIEMAAVSFAKEILSSFSESCFDSIMSFSVLQHFLLELVSKYLYRLCKVILLSVIIRLFLTSPSTVAYLIYLNHKTEINKMK